MGLHEALGQWGGGIMFTAAPTGSRKRGEDDSEDESGSSTVGRRRQRLLSDGDDDESDGAAVAGAAPASVGATGAGGVPAAACFWLVPQPAGGVAWQRVACVVRGLSGPLAAFLRGSEVECVYDGHLGCEVSFGGEHAVPLSGAGPLFSLNPVHAALFPLAVALDASATELERMLGLRALHHFLGTACLWVPKFASSGQPMWWAPAAAGRRRAGGLVVTAVLCGTAKVCVPKPSPLSIRWDSSSWTEVCVSAGDFVVLPPDVPRFISGTDGDNPSVLVSFIVAEEDGLEQGGVLSEHRVAPRWLVSAALPDFAEEDGSDDEIGMAGGEATAAAGRAASGRPRGKRTELAKALKKARIYVQVQEKPAGAHEVAGGEDATGDDAPRPGVMPEPEFMRLAEKLVETSSFEIPQEVCDAGDAAKLMEHRPGLRPWLAICNGEPVATIARRLGIAESMVRRRAYRFDLCRRFPELVGSTLTLQEYQALWTHARGASTIDDALNPDFKQQEQAHGEEGDGSEAEAEDESPEDEHEDSIAQKATDMFNRRIGARETRENRE